MKTNIVLGISAYYHDSAAALLKNGRIIAAVQEERFTRIKGDSSFPHNAINYCLNECGISIEDVGYIVFYEDSVEKFERLLVMTHLTAPKSLFMFLSSMPKWLSKNLWMESTIAKELGIKRKKILFCKHHISHAASAFYPSPFEEAAFLTIDGVGEWSTATYGFGRSNKITTEKKMSFPNSLGLLYSAFTFYCGFKINSGEYKLMGLAPYGEPIYAETIRKKIVHINNDGSIVINQKYFDYTFGLKTINKNFETLFGKQARVPESPITKHEMDIAASIQTVTDEVVLRMAKHVKNETQCQNLVLAGGVALNVVSMGNLLRNSGFKDIWIQPAAGDAGGALGAAMYIWHHLLDKKRTTERKKGTSDTMNGALLGPEILPDDIKDDETLKKLGGVWINVDEQLLSNKVAHIINDNKIIGIARGKMEWGPRALGNRSILANAKDIEMQSKLNLKTKFRESFRPFAPMVLNEDKSNYFEMADESPYMLLTFPVCESRRLPFTINNTDDIIKLVNEPRSDIPAVTHLDYSARVQTVTQTMNRFIYSVLLEYKQLSECSVVINTSFNVRGEPIVNTASEAYRCFMSTEMDYVVIGNRLFDKKEQQTVK